MMLRKKLKISQIITIVCAVLMGLAIFLPYLTFSEGAEKLYSDVSGAASFSLLKMTQMESDFWPIILIYLIIIILAIVMGALKWSVGAIIFSIIGMGWLTLITYVALTIDSEFVKLGEASYVTYIAGIGVIVASVQMRRTKQAIKNEPVR